MINSVFNSPLTIVDTGDAAEISPANNSTSVFSVLYNTSFVPVTITAGNAANTTAICCCDTAAVTDKFHRTIISAGDTTYRRITFDSGFIGNITDQPQVFSCYAADAALSADTSGKCQIRYTRAFRQAAK